MLKKLLLSSAVFVLGSGVAAVANASTITASLTTGLSCSITAPCGTVSVTDNSGGGVTVTETLLNGNFFVVTGNGSNHPSLAFDIDSGTPANFTVTSTVPSGVSFTLDTNASPAGYSGDYNYFAQLNGCNGSSCPMISTLTFTLTGITTGSFDVTDGFVSDINVAGATGNVGGTPTENHNPPPMTPEPSSLALLGTGVLGLAGAVRRKFSRS